MVDTTTPPEERGDGYVRHGGLAFRIVSESPVLRIERTGAPELPHLKAHALAIVAEAHRRHASLLLIDERGIDGYVADRLEALLLYRDIAREAQAKGLADRPLRIAMLSPPQGDSEREVFARNATGVGFDMAYFEDESDALLWLGLEP